MGQTTNNPLPETYYLDYFNFLLSFTQKNYANIIGKKELSFIKKFQTLSFEAKCLFVRISNRKGPAFRASKLVYREIPNLNPSIKELCRNEFVSFENKLDAKELLLLFTKTEILKLGKVNDWQSLYSSSSKKDDIIFSITDGVNEDKITKILFDEEVIIFFECVELINFFKLLFFGDLYSDMTQFVIKDLGNIKLEDFTGVTFSPNFDTREEIDEYIKIAKIYQEFKSEKELLSPLDCYYWFNDLQLTINSPNHKKIKSLYKRFIIKLAKHLETNNLLTEALEIYQKLNVSPVRERRVRLLAKLNELAQANQLAKEILENPEDANEELFAKDFLNAKEGKIKKSTTRSLKTAEEIVIERNTSINVEQQAIAYFESKGYHAFHTENTLWRFLFGLVFWEETYDLSQNSFHHPLQRSPSDLRDLSFYEKRSVAIDKRLKSIRSKKKFNSLVNDTYSLKYGIANYLVFWNEQLLEVSLKSIELLPLIGLKKILLMIAKHVKTNSTGFPDLFIFRNKEYHFYEIKSPTDQLSAQQLFWIDYLNKCKIKADVLKVKWQK